MKKLNGLLLILFTLTISAQYVRKDIRIPDILGYQTLKCDFHSHTVFSDGNVWPDLRIREAFIQGLDAIAITDHIEYLPHKKDIIKNHNRSYEIAKEKEATFGVTVIKGSEITRSMPPGHLNALFNTDSNPIDTSDFMTAIKIAKEQGAFIQWNHPFWQKPVFPLKDGKPTWFPIHQELIDKGFINGIEVVNENEYYPDVFRWCLENNITIMGNSDIHDPSGYFWDYSKNEHRPVTLVFAKDKSEKSIKEALFDHRTAVYFSDTLLGKQEFLSEIFGKSVQVLTDQVSVNKGSNIFIKISNLSDIPFRFRLAQEDNDFNLPASFSLPAQSTVLISTKPKSKDLTGSFNLIMNYKVTNLLISPEENLLAKLKVNISLR